MAQYDQVGKLVQLGDSTTSTLGSVKVDGAIANLLTVGGLMMSGYVDALGVQKYIRVDAAGALVVSGGGGSSALNVFTGAAPTFATVGVASANILAVNASRKMLVLTVTTPGEKVSLGLSGNAAVLNSGITLFAGQPYTMDAAQVSTGAIAAIASAAGVNLAIQQGS